MVQDGYGKYNKGRAAFIYRIQSTVVVKAILKRLKDRQYQTDAKGT